MSSVSKQARKPSAALNADMGRASSTKSQDVPAIKLFNYLLSEILCLSPIDEISMEQLKEGVEDILTGYSLYLCNTNIPKNHEKYLLDKDAPPPNDFMKFSGLTEYLSKAIQLLKKIMPDSFNSVIISSILNFFNGMIV